MAEKPHASPEAKPKSKIVEQEAKTLAFWADREIFKKTLARKGKDFVFYDGPPFATGLPHFGHLLPTTIKDIIPRYKTMQGYKVSRRWGWDCHGLPVENLIEKELGLKSKKDIVDYGIGKFNAAAEASVLRYVEKLLPTYGPPKDGQGWWVSLTFWRPLDGKAIKRELPKVLAAFYAIPNAAGLDAKLARNFELEIRPAGIPVANHFMLGASSDFDQGGFVASEIIRNLNLCITEKAAKIAPYKDRYQEWWLVLPDHIGPDLNADERSTIGEHVNLLTFSRVVLIHPRDPTKALVISEPAAAIRP